VTNNQRFPDGFVWGAATASYQIEGAVNEGGRGPSIWDTFSHTPGRTLNGDTGDVACQHYSRLEEDLGLIKQLGLGAYRFSIAWPRIQPDGKGPANQAGLDFYRRLVAGLRERGTVPAATLYHWDLPQALEDQGGWTVRDTAERFGEYVAMVADALGDEVGMWITLNEPWCSAWLGYAIGAHAPGISDLGASVRATHHLLLAHARGTDVLRSVTKAPVGITLNLSPSIPASDHDLDVAAARMADGGVNRMYLEPLFKGRYPEDMVELLSNHGASFGVVGPGDMEAISRPVDFLGVNYYMTNVFADAGRLDEARQAGYIVTGALPGDASAVLGLVQVLRPDLERTATGWEIDPKGLTDILVSVRDHYTEVPLYITENGAAQHDYRGPDGAVHDDGRTRYLAQHINAVKDAIDQGVNVKGYFVWSLMDNYEWSAGYSMRFGIVWVDYPTGERVPKDSFRWYSQVVAANGVPPAPKAPSN
jgi:beta-glucosidase